MASKSADMRNGLVTIVCSLAFVVLTLLVPLLRVLGGFLQGSRIQQFQGQDEVYRIDFYWDAFRYGWLGLIDADSYPELVTSLKEANRILTMEVIWQIIPLWGFVWILLSFLGAILVIIPAVQKLFGQKPTKIWIIGLVIGLIGTIIEYGLFIILWLLEDWSEWPIPPELNFILLGCFIIGWVAFIIGAIFVRKPTIS